MSYVIANRGGHVATVNDDGSVVYGSRYGGRTESNNPDNSVGYANFSGSNIARSIANELQTSDSNYASMARELFDYSEANSAFNAREAAKARSWSADQNALAMQHSAAEAQKNRDWQERLSNTAHQRAVNDLISAGLNPVLGAMSGASTPSGSVGQGFSGGSSAASADSSAGSIASLFSSVVNNAMAAELQRERFSLENEIVDKQLATETLKSENQLLGTRLSSQATMAAAGTSAAAQRYYSDTLHDIQTSKEMHDRLMAGINYGYTSELEGTKHNYNRELENIRQSGSNSRSLVGSINDIVGGFEDTHMSVGRVIGKGLGFLGRQLDKYIDSKKSR